MTNKNEAEELLREAFDVLSAFKGGGSDELNRAHDLCERIGKYFARQPSAAIVDTSTVAQDLSSVASGATGFGVDQAMKRMTELAKPGGGAGRPKEDSTRDAVEADRRQLDEPPNAG